jgi:hypothetical protein
MIVYKLDERGGFTAGDTETGITSYAYPSSVWAVTARSKPMKAAQLMISMERECMHESDYAKAYDARNWVTLGGRK